MPMVDTILRLMLQDHAEIFRRLGDFEEGSEKDPRASFPLFDKFQWKLEQHMLIEERVIFGYTSFSRQSNAMIQQVLDDHRVLSVMLKAIQKRLQAGPLDVDISDFKKQLDDHRLFEERELYPKIDQELDVKAKQFIIDQLKTRLF